MKSIELVHLISTHYRMHTFPHPWTGLDPYLLSNHNGLQFFDFA